ncbi:MAG: trypsin-like peptidase domain-containing protein [Clostridia bacterium]|nr:trypsin-like peptidase domain-containing protein [Clostridia bacterium]
MDNLNDNINNQNTGSLEGFDSVETASGKENDTPQESGYTVTPEGGFYTKSKSEIIQDEALPSQTEEQPPKSEQEQTDNSTPPTTDYYSGDNYGYRPPFNPPPVRNNKPKGRYGAGVVIASALLAAVIGAVSGIAAMRFVNEEAPTVIETPSTTGNQVNINIDKTAESVVEAVAEKVTPSVIGIRTTTSVKSFFGGSSESTGEGSGVIYSSDGYIITNYHVIADAATNSSNSKIEVFLDTAGSKSYEATVVGYNISADLAVIKINVTGLTAVEIADSSKVKVGQYVITIGNPGGLEFMDSVTYGVISGLNRVVSSDSGIELIQTDAAINPGNSGGALVNTKGQLVGINSSKIVSEEYEGMGFAIPSNAVVEICENIIEKQNSPEPYIGISISEKYTKRVLQYYGFPSGAVVSGVADGSPAYNAGIERGDIITEFNGTEITEYTVLEQLMSNATPGAAVTVKLYRNGRYYSTTITVGSNNAVG